MKLKLKLESNNLPSQSAQKIGRMPEYCTSMGKKHSTRADSHFSAPEEKKKQKN